MSLLTIALLTITTSAVPETSVTSPQAELLPIEQNVISQTNSERARRGWPPLQIDFRLMESARRHAAWMAGSPSVAAYDRGRGREYCGRAVVLARGGP